MHALDDPHARPFARTAGVLYLVIAMAGFFSILWVPSRLTAPGDPAATLALVADRPGLFVGGDVVMMLAEVVLSVMLFAMFRPFGAVLATAAMVARLMMAAVMAAMLLPQAAVLWLALPDVPLGALDAAARAELAWMLSRMDAAGVWVWQPFFAVHLWLLGTLAWRARAVPRLLAAGMVVGGTGYLVDSVRAFAFPDAPLLPILGGALLAVVTLAEIGFALWLLMRGRVATPLATA
jgi:hypothetical protein